MTEIAAIGRLPFDQKGLRRWREEVLGVAFFDQGQCRQAVEHDARGPRIGTCFARNRFGAIETFADQREKIVFQRGSVDALG